MLHDPSSIKSVLTNKYCLNRVSWKGEWEQEYVISIVQENGIEWQKRRKLGYSLLINIINSEFHENVLKKTLNKYTIPNIKKCIKNKQLWYIRNDCKHISFNVIFNATFGIYSIYIYLILFCD